MIGYQFCTYVDVETPSMTVIDPCGSMETELLNWIDWVDGEEELNLRIPVEVFGGLMKFDAIRFYEVPSDNDDRVDYDDFNADIEFLLNGKRAFTAIMSDLDGISLGGACWFIITSVNWDLLKDNVKQ